MRKKSIITKLITCALAVSTLLLTAPITSANAAVTWNNTSDVSWIDSNKKLIAFAFDDGPVSYSNTANSILDTLEKYKMHATFFYIGNQINANNTSEIKRADKLGCEVASHTYTHPYLTNLSTSNIQNEVNKTSNLLKGITGKSNFLIRPPYLAVNQTVLNTINVPLVTCDIDTQDWNNATKDQIINKVLTQAKDGDILLMHETYNTTAQAVAYLIPELMKRGYEITSVSELFKMKGQTMTSGKVYSSCPGPNVVKNSHSTTPTNPSNDGLKLDYSINNWGSGYQVNFKIKNNSTANVSTWTLKLKKSEINIRTSWNVNVKEDGNYYVITPIGWNSSITSGSSIDFGVQGSGNVSSKLNYTLN